MKKDSTTNELTIKEQDMLSTDVLMAFEDAGEGTENIKASDLLIPFLRVIQSNTKQLSKSQPEYIPGAESGLIFNTATRELFKEIYFVPSLYRTKFIEWIPRSKGGGKVAEYLDPKELPDTFIGADNKCLTKEGNEIIEYYEFYGMRVDVETGDCEPVVIPFANSQIRSAKQMLSYIMNCTVSQGGVTKQAPIFAQTFKLYTSPSSNQKGDWYKWVVARHGKNTSLGERDTKPSIEFGSVFYQAAKRLKQSIEDGSMRADEQEDTLDYIDHSKPEVC